MKTDLGLGLGSLSARRKYGTPAPTPAPAAGPYLPTLSSSALAAWGARRMVAGYGGNLYKLRRSSDNATLDVAAASGSDLPDYSAITAWSGAAALSVTTIYDQSGNGKNLAQATANRQPLFDPAQALAGCVPFTLAGIRNSSSVFQYMETAATLSLDRQNASVWTVMQPMFSTSVQLFWQLRSGASTILNCYLSGGVGLTAYDGTTIRATTAARTPRAMPSVIGVNGSTSTVVTCREGSDTIANGAAAAASIFQLGETGSFGTNYNSQFHCWGACLYPSLSSGDQTTLRQALETMLSIPTSFTSRIVFNGDSIMEGYGATFLRNMANQLSGLPGTPEIFNLGIYGRAAANEQSTYSARAAPLFSSAYGAGKCLYLTEVGINDIIGGTTATSLEAIIGGGTGRIIDLAKATGFRTGLATLLPTNNGGLSAGEETERQAYNAWVLAGSSGADFTVDAATATNLSSPASSTYYIDGLHPTSAGYAQLASSRYGPALTVALA